MQPDPSPISAVPLVAGIDLARHVFQVCCGEPGTAVPRNRAYSRDNSMLLLGRLPPGSTVASEACGSCHYWARCRASLGLEVRVIPASFIHSLNMACKDDRTDAMTITGSPGGLPSGV